MTNKIKIIAKTDPIHYDNNRRQKNNNAKELKTKNE